MKILGLGFVLNRGSYLRDVWNLLDFTIVISGYLPLILSTQGGSSINLSGLRSLRVLRPLKTLNAIQKLRSLIVTIFSAIPYLLEIMVVLVFTFLIFSIAGLQLFSGLLQNTCIDEVTGKFYAPDGNPLNQLLCTKNSCPSSGDGFGDPTKGGYSKLFCGKNSENPDYNVSNFDNIMYAFLNVYIVTTLEGWTLLMKYVQDTFNYFFAFYFIMIVFIGAFFLINLTLAVITIKFNEAQQNSKKEEALRKKIGSHLIKNRQRRLLHHHPKD